MTIDYRESVGGTLIEEFVLVSAGPWKEHTASRRRHRSRRRAAESVGVSLRARGADEQSNGVSARQLIALVLERYSDQGGNGKARCT